MTSDILVTVEGHHDGALPDVAAALEDLRSLLDEHISPGSMRSATLSADALSLD